MLLSESPPQIEFHTIPDGAGGTRATLRLMSQVVKQARADPVIRDTAADLVLGCSPGDYRGEVECLFEFVRDNIRYLQDTNGLERLEYPTILLKTKQGDCDDKATLLAALLESIGHPARFVAVGYQQPGEFEHVYVETRIGSNWIAAETTLNVDLGWAPVPPNVDTPIICKMIEHI